MAGCIALTEPFFACARERLRAQPGAVRCGHRWIALVRAGRCARHRSWLLLAMLPRELAPLEDRGRIWVRATAPEGVGYEYMQRVHGRAGAARRPSACRKQQCMMTQVPGVARRTGRPGRGQHGFVRLFLKDESERERSQAGDRRDAAERWQRSNSPARASMSRRKRASASGAPIRAACSSSCRRRELEALRGRAAAVSR